jgi:cytochrome c oxidase cbb3-type subunit 1
MSAYSLNVAAPSEVTPPQPASSGIRGAAWHSLFWLVCANGIGVLISILLLFPALNRLMGEWTYGRWIMVHLNLELYGWTSLPLAGFLLNVYGADRQPFVRWCRPALWVWSTALGIGALSWLSGHSSGKLFLDWSGYARVLFPLAMVALWLLLAASLSGSWKDVANSGTFVRAAKIAGLVLLLVVPALIYIAASPTIYPAINPDTGGPTGASQLESSLVVVAILLLLPFGLTRRIAGHGKILTIAWIVLIAESLLCAALGRTDISHHRPAQYLSLASLLIWIPLTSAYYSAFQWRPNTRRWRSAFLWWWAALLVSGWVLFLPGVLDHFKFTDGLVGHSFVAMAGFTSSLIIFVMVHLLGDEARIFNGTRAFLLWHASVLGYVAVMTIAGWQEGFDPAFTIVPGILRDSLYVLRLLVGVLMFIASVDWLAKATDWPRVTKPAIIALPRILEKTA